jgi:hypothetical protein
MTQNHKRNFLVYTLGRTGSTLLQTLINNLPSSQCEGEILSSAVSDPVSFVIERSERAKELIYGFKVKTSHIQKSLLDPKDFLKEMHDYGFKFIHLERENVLKMVLSYLYARDTGSFFHYKSWLSFLRSKPEITVDIDELFKLLEENTLLKKYDKKLLENYNHLHLSYEQNLEKQSSHSDCLNKVSEFLNCSRSSRTNFTVKTPLDKSVPDPKKQVKNWQEVEKSLQGSPYSHFLSF